MMTDSETAAPSISRLRWVARGCILVLSSAILGVLAGAWYCTSMPGASHAGALAPMTPEESAVSARARAHVERLATTIGPRNDDHPEAYREAQAYLEAELTSFGYEVSRHPVTTPKGTWYNIEATKTGRANKLVVFGAHYDSCLTTPGADDNASGVAALLELARLLASKTPQDTVRFVFFANEEPPHFQRETMGSLQYAKMARARGDEIDMMYSLEMLGFFSAEPDSQHYPPILDMFYPTVGDFVAFVSNFDHRDRTREVVGGFREKVAFPSEGFAGPSFVQGIDYSDHWSFWMHGYPAILVTDTSFFRTPHYHKMTDVPETLDYERLARVVVGLKTLAMGSP